MDGDTTEGSRVPFPIRIQPGTLEGGWQATFEDTAVITTTEFRSALDLLRWLEGLDHRKTPPQSGLR